MLPRRLSELPAATSEDSGVQRLAAQQFGREGWSRPDSHGCKTIDVELQLHG